MTVRACSKFGQVLSLFLWVMITLGSALSAEAQMSCRSSQAIPDHAALIQHWEEALFFEPVTTEAWQRHIQAIRTPKDYFRFLQFLESLRVRPLSGKYDVTGFKRERILLEILRQVDWVSPLIRFREQLTDRERGLLMEQGRRLTQEVPYFHESIENAWNSLQVVYRLALQPETVSEFIHSVSSTENFRSNSTFQFSLSGRAALLALPQSLFSKARLALREELSTEYRKFATERQKERRRNLEAVQHFLYSNPFRHLVYKLKSKQQIPAENLISLVDQYWLHSTSVQREMGYGGYSFQKVLDVAQLIQKNMRSEMADGSIVLYGSFSNGKARLEASDVDAYPDGSLRKRIADGIQGAYQVDKAYANSRGGEASHSIKLLSDALIQTENAIAAYLERTVKRPAELFALAQIPEGSPLKQFYESGQALFYNPIAVRIFADHLELEIYDSIQNQKIRLKIQ